MEGKKGKVHPERPVVSIVEPSRRARPEQSRRARPEQSRRVFVAISGGVDSSVAAALLKKATPNNFEKLFGRPTPEGFRGYEVTGVFMKVWQPDFLPCSWEEERLSAMRVAAELDIPFVTLNLEKEYKRDVVDYMIQEYKAGRTPNPDIFCNKYIKFGAFLKYAKKMGADFIATGHHARIHSQHDANIQMTANDANEYKLCMGVDSEKDQSYFLWTLTQEELRYTLFPIGKYTKPEVRGLARKFKLPTAEKKDSQGLCFVGKVDMREFLKHFIETKRGNVLDEKGTVIGSHDGAELYTIGQRHGFSVFARSSNEKPHYIIGKDIRNNTLIVSSDSKGSEADHGKRKVFLTDANWISEKPSLGKTYQGRYRYRQALEPCRVAELADSEAMIEFERKQVLPKGQSLVLYDPSTSVGTGGEVCLGGGVIAGNEN